MLDYLICYVDKDVLKKLAIVLGVIALAIRIWQQSWLYL